MTNKTQIAELRSNIESAADCGYIHPISIDGRTAEWLLDQLEAAEARIAELESESHEYAKLAGKNAARTEKAEGELAKLKGDAVPVSDANPVLGYADSYRSMAKQGVDNVPIWCVITDLERNIAPLFTDAQPMPAGEKWTKCSDRMPEYGRYLVKCEDPVGLGIVTAQWIRYQYSSCKDSITEMWRDDRSRSMNRMKDVTHWMPLPCAPKSADGEGE
ncbi:DUF551 domain-containing protein [Rouxiella badensis]|uniref:DUF551 domain-containing protein n=1 Tax=Rouxiella badensis TaxID=1646377 RepID=UPI001D157656|nr:DUF551 domain-containing protein [Rouxiella badensis]MCC3745289.1 DUF551 domain-containing protein [Rouxiella badensis]